MFEVIRDLEKYISKNISEELTPATKALLERLVFFCKKHIASKVLGMIDEINESLLDRFCGYIMSTFPRPVTSGDPKSLNIQMMASIDTKIADKLLSRIKLLSPQLNLKDAVFKLDGIRATNEKSNDFEGDKEMLTSAILEVLTSQHLGVNLPEHKTPPLLELPLSEIVVTKQRDSSSSREDRLKERATCRAFLAAEYKAELRNQVEQRIIQIIENVTANTKVEGEIVATDPLKVEDNYSNKRLLGWINLDKFLLKTDVSLKKLFINYINLVFEHMVKLETFEFRILKEYLPVPKPKPRLSLELANHDPDADTEVDSFAACKIIHSEDKLEELFNFAHFAFKQSVISLVAVLIVLDHYSFLYTQQSYFTKDMLASSLHSGDDVENMKKVILNEIKNLKTDEARIILLPDTLTMGLFRIQLSPSKTMIIQQINENKKSLKRSSLNEMKNQLDHIESGIKFVYSVCDTIPGQVDEYIELKRKLESEEFQRKIQRLQIYSQAFDALVCCLETLRTVDDLHELLLRKLFINTKLKSCFEDHKVFSEKFKNSRLNFYDEILLHRIEMVNEFQVMYAALTQKRSDRVVQEDRGLRPRRRDSGQGLRDPEATCSHPCQSREIVRVPKRARHEDDRLR